MIDIVNSIGEPACLEQLAEESTELAQAALKLARVMRDENPTPVTYKKAEENLLEEIADVRLCLSVISPILGKLDTYEMERKKLARWIRRLRDVQRI